MKNYVDKVYGKWYYKNVPIKYEDIFYMTNKKNIKLVIFQDI